MTCVAVMVTPLVVPSTSTGSPIVMALAEVELVPFWYLVEDASSTVTFTPADVDIVKLDVDTLPTVPMAPPEAGPERALDPAPDKAVAVPPPLLPQAARIAVVASKRKGTRMFLCDLVVRVDISLTSFSALWVTQ